MKNTNVNSDGSINISDLEGNNRYRYYVTKNAGTPEIVILCEGKTYIITAICPSIANIDGNKCIEYIIIDETYADDDGYGSNAIIVNPMHVDFEDGVAAFTKSLIIAENIVDVINRFSQMCSEDVNKEEVYNIENFNMNSDGFVVVSDNSKEKYRY